MHCCQQGIYVDEQDFMVDDAIETVAHNISVMYHMMMMPVASRQNIQKLLQSCDVGIDHIVFDAVTSAEYSLMSDERQQGVCLVDIKPVPCLWHGRLRPLLSLRQHCFC